MGLAVQIRLKVYPSFHNPQSTHLLTFNLDFLSLVIIFIQDGRC